MSYFLPRILPHKDCFPFAFKGGKQFAWFLVFEFPNLPGNSDSLAIPHPLVFLMFVFVRKTRKTLVVLEEHGALGERGLRQGRGTRLILHHLNPEVKKILNHSFIL